MLTAGGAQIGQVNAERMTPEQLCAVLASRGIYPTDGQTYEWGETVEDWQPQANPGEESTGKEHEAKDPRRKEPKGKEPKGKKELKRGIKEPMADENSDEELARLKAEIRAELLAEMEAEKNFKQEL